jgi:hypothetical protein
MVALPFCWFVVAVACGGGGDNVGFGSGKDGGGGSGGGGGGGGDSGPITLGQNDSGSGSNDATVVVGDPTTCTQAAASKSYVGCDYWPTVTANLVESVFDFTAVVANTQSTPASVTVTGPNNFSATTSVAANALAKIYLPWVTELKGPDVTASDSSFTASVTVPKGAYHLVSSIPVTVYQFNALEYKGQGGASGKDWSKCTVLPGASGCFSYSNDASVLLPSTAMTGNYRVTGEHGSSLLKSGGFIAITSTQDNTPVTVTLSSTASVVAGGGISAAGPGGTVTFTLMNAGDVAELMGTASDTVDLSGSLVYSTKPVQVIAGRQCANQPDPIAACDHLESSVLPAETLGKDYVVTVPTSPNQTVVGHMVRFFGNVDNTTLTYSPSQPTGCPSTLNAGQVVECTGTAGCATGVNNNGLGGKVSVSCVTESFEVTGNHEFAVSSFMLGGSAVDHGTTLADDDGDPSMSPMVAVEQYRMRYIFLAPTDYDQSYADVVVPAGASITLDGAGVTAAPTTLNGSWSIVRVLLGAGQDGAHLMTGTAPFGVQVLGYGAYTSYQYPAGLDLAEIAPPPPPPASK